MTCVSKGLGAEAERVMYRAVSFSREETIDGFLLAILLRPIRGSFVRSLFLGLPAFGVRSPGRSRWGRTGKLITFLLCQQHIPPTYEMWNAALLSEALFLCPNIIEVRVISLSSLRERPTGRRFSIPNEMTSTGGLVPFSHPLRPLSLPPSLEVSRNDLSVSMPKLKNVAGYFDIIEALVPYRPVQDVILIGGDEYTPIPISTLVALGLSSGPVTRLLFLSMYGFGMETISVVGHHVPSLQFLRISASPLLHTDGTAISDFVRGIEKGLAALPCLKELEISLPAARNLGEDQGWSSVIQGCSTKIVGQEWSMVAAVARMRTGSIHFFRRSI